MRFRRIKVRFLLLSTGIFCAAFLLTAPAWMPWVVVPTLNRFGVHLSSYERASYKKFVLHNVFWQESSEGIIFQAEKLECPTLPFFILGLFEKAPQNHVLVENWKLTIPKPKSATVDEGEDETPFALAEDMHSTLYWITPWLIHGELIKGKLEIYERTDYITKASWGNRTLKAEGITQNESEPFSATVEGLGTEHTQFNLTLPRKTLKLTGKSSLSQKSLDIQATLELQENKLSGSCKFLPKKLYPSEANLHTDHFVIDDNIISIDGYNPWELALDALWKDGQYTISLTGEASSKQKSAPPLTAELKAHGTPQYFRLDDFSLDAKNVTSTLEKNQERKADITYSVNLDAIKIIPATGVLTGSLQFQDVPDTPLPLIKLTASGKSISFLNHAVKTLSAKGDLNWPHMEVKQCSVKTNEGSSLEFQGKLNLEEQTFKQCSLNVTLNAALLESILESSPATLKQSTFSATLSGPLATPTYTAQGSIDNLGLEHFYPLSGSFEIEGNGQHIQAIALKLTTTEEGALSLSAKGTISTKSLALDITEAVFSGNDRHTLALQKPTHVAFEWWISGNNKANWFKSKLKVDDLTLQAEEGTTLNASLYFKQMQSGSINIEAKKWEKTALPLTLQMPDWAKYTEIDNFELTSNWDESPATFTLKMEGAYTLEGDQKPILLSIDAQGDKKGIDVKTCSFTRGDETILSGQGILPVIITPSNANETIAFIRKAPMKFAFHSTPAPVFWQEFGSITGISLTQPTVDLTIKGTPDRPKGTLSIKATSIAFKGKNAVKLPKLESLDLDLALSPQGLSINKGNLLIEEEPASITGTLPWDTNATSPFTPEIKGARLSVTMNKAPMSTFRPWLPDFVKNEGYAKASLSLIPPLQLKGTLEISNAATYPINPVGSMRDIQANIEFEETRIQIKTLQGMLSEHPLSLKGNIDTTDVKNPKFNISLQGKSIPLVREPGVIVRGDVDLKVKTNKTTKLSGKINLADSVLLMDLGELVASIRTAKTTQASSVGITTKPFSEWKLDIELEGKDFMRIRTPIFESRLSANIDLGGQLKDPIPSGTLTLHGGYVKFPFATLEVSSGNVTLPKGDPFNALLDVTAKGRSYGYDIKLTVKGTAEEPQLIFSSNPSLESGEILLLVSTGRLPDDDDSDTGKQLGTLGVFLGSNILSELGMDDSSFQNRVRIRVGEDITEAGKDTIEVDYKLSDRWSIIGQYDRFDEYDLDFKVKVYSK